MFSLFKSAVIVGVLMQTAIAHAGGYGYSRSYQKVYAQPLVQTYYFVGQPIRAAAIVQAELRADPEYAEFQAFKAWRQGQVAAPQQQQPQQPEVLPQQAPPHKPEQPVLQIAASCVRCHSQSKKADGTLVEPKGGLDLTKAITLEQYRGRPDDDESGILNVVLKGLMPPPTSSEGKAFDGDKASLVILEAGKMIGEEAAHAPPPPIEAPPPVPPGALP